MSELLIAKGQLADLNKKMEEYERKADALLILIREKLNPYESFLQLDIDTTLMLVKEFRELQLKARECMNKIAKIKETYNL
jgi:hypothetical protein